MAFALVLFQTAFPYKPSPGDGVLVRPVKMCSTPNQRSWRCQLQVNKKRCLRCNTLYSDQENSPAVCFFHGHINGEKGLFALVPPHQGVDGEWTDQSGVIVYKWNEKENRPNTGRVNWKRRWSCCAEYDENAKPCSEGGMFPMTMGSLFISLCLWRM